MRHTTSTYHIVVRHHLQGILDYHHISYPKIYTALYIDLLHDHIDTIQDKKRLLQS